MKLGFLLLLGSAWLSWGGELPGGTVLIVEHEAGAAKQSSAWNCTPNAVCCPEPLTNGSSATLRYRYAFESQPDQTYLLRRQFTLWSNRVVVGSVSLSNLVSGDGFTRWETNALAAQVQQGVATFRAGDAVLGQLQAPSLKPQESRKRQARSPALAVGLTRVVLERYDIGCTGCAGTAEPGEPGITEGGKELRFSLGRTWYGQAVGELAVPLETSGPTLGQPSWLRLLALPEAVTVVRQGGELRQVAAPQCLADILKLGECHYQIVFYATNARLPEPAVAELFPTNGLSVLVRWTLEAPENAPLARQFRVVAESGSVQVTNLYTWNEGGWELLAGNGLRREMFTEERDPTGQTRTECWQTFEPADNRLVAQRTAQYHRFPWGEELVEEVVGANGEGGTNRFSYYEAPEHPSVGRLRELSRSDGYWERYEYNEQGRLVTRYSPFANTPQERYAQGRQETCNYEPWRAWGDDGMQFPLRPRTTTESIGGKVVSKSYFIPLPCISRREEVPLSGSRETNLTAPSRLTSVPTGLERALTLDLQCTQPSQVPFDAPVLCTTNHLYITDAGTRLRLRKVELPDGTVETYEYSRSPFTITEVHSAGAPDASHAAVVSGTRTLAVQGNLGQMLLQAAYDVSPGRTNILLAREAYAYLDPLQRSRAVQYLDGTSNVVQYACCGLDSQRDRDGVLQLYQYDALKRVRAVMRFAGSPEPVTTHYLLDAAGQVASVVRVGKDAKESLRLRATAYDTAGQVCWETNGLDGVTHITYGFDAAGRRTRLREYPDGGRSLESRNRDGTLYEVSGTAVHGVRYEYGVDESGQRFTREIKLSANGEPTREWVADYVDWLGRDVKTEYPDGAYSQQFYNEQGQLSRERDPDGVLTLYGYNARGECDTEAVRVDATAGDGAIAFSGRDRITRTVREVMFDPVHGANVARSRRYVWDAERSGQSNLVSTVDRTVDGLRTWQTLWPEAGGAVQRTEWVLGPEGTSEQFEYAADGAWKYYRYRCGRLELFQERDGLGDTNAQSSFRYDAHDRLWQQNDWHQGTLTYAYNAADLVSTETREPVAPGQKPLTTRTEYNAMLQATNVVLPGGQSLRTEYHLTGEVRQRQGWHSFPVAYTCDYAGRVQTMTTWSNAQDTNTAHVTTWSYDPQRGWLTRKRFADGTGPDYEHTSAGRVRKRIWARETVAGSGLRVDTLYAYNAGGDLERVTYNDGITPDLSYQYDRRGRVQSVTQGIRTNAQSASVTRLTYHRSGLPTGEEYVSGLLAGLVVTNLYDAVLRRTNLTLCGAGGVLDSVVYAYNNARLKSVLQPAFAGGRSVSASYAYEPGSPRVKQIEFRVGDASRLVCTRQYDPEGRPLASATAPTGAPAMTFDYAYDAAGQVSRATLTDCSYWQYRYDTLGQLRCGLKYRSDRRLVEGLQFEYEFDDTGARTHTRGSGPDAVGADRSAEARSSSSWGYDADGNLTNNGRWSFTWDAENRLIRMQLHPEAGAPVRLDFVYDWRGRRVQKELSVWNVARQQYERRSQLNFIYDDWNLLAVLNAQRLLVTSFTWGVELNPGPAGMSGGGAGGLLLVRNYPGPRRGPPSGELTPDTYFAVFDGEGNLVGLVSARDGKSAAQFEYGPFGEPVPSVSPGVVNPRLKFLTRYEDEESGLLYCGYRYYDPCLGRWLNREPLHEYAFWQLQGERLLAEMADDGGLFGPEDYVYSANAPVGNIDALGLFSSCDEAVQNALRSRGSRRLLRMISKAGFPAPRVVGSDTEHYCDFPGFLGDYDCPKRVGKICCRNVENQEQMETTTRHELVHALDCCRNGLETCHDHLCSEVVAYYMADCARFVNRLECALGQMRASRVGDARCASQAAAMSKRTARQCVQDWEKRERGP